MADPNLRYVENGGMSGSYTAPATGAPVAPEIVDRAADAGAGEGDDHVAAAAAARRSHLLARSMR